MDDIVEKLKEFGFNSYEAKVYIALLKKYPATGYEVSQIADIPQSRAYDALKALVNSQIAFSTKEKPQKYTPISPKELTRRYRRKMSSAIDYLEKKLPDVREDYTEPVHMIGDYEKVLDKLKEVIKNTQNAIYLEVWAEDFKLLYRELENAYDRGVDIKIVGYDNISAPFGLIYSHFGGKDIEYSLGSRLVYLVADDIESVFGKVGNRVVWTKNEDIAFLLKQFIVHDMYLLDVNKQFPEQLKYFYGAGFRKLKEKILTKNSKFNIH